MLEIFSAREVLVSTCKFDSTSERAEDGILTTGLAVRPVDNTTFARHVRVVDS